MDAAAAGGLRALAAANAASVVAATSAAIKNNSVSPINHILFKCSRRFCNKREQRSLEKFASQARACLQARPPSSNSHRKPPAAREAQSAQIRELRGACGGNPLRVESGFRSG